MTNRNSAKSISLEELRRVNPAISQMTGASLPRKKAVQDLIIILVASVALFGTLVALDADVFEIIAKWSQELEEWEVDEVFSLTIFLACALTVFSLRRWKELRDEITLRERLEAELFSLNEELESRVEERTADLFESRKRINSQLEERKALLREIHHRVRNNFSIVIGLLELRSYHGTDAATGVAIREMRDRIHAMALAHELLCGSDNLSEVDIGEYLEILMDHVVASSGVSPKIPDLKKDIENISVGLDTAIHLGCLLVELLSNCLKHAFPEQKEGEIRVSLKSVGENEFQLVVADNGVGMPNDVDPKNPQSLGLDLVNIFTDHLNGTLEIDREGGTKFRVTFKDVNQSRNSDSQH